MRQAPGQGERIVRALQGLVRIPERPKGMSSMAEAAHSWIVPTVKKGQRVMLRNVERSPAFRMLSGQGQLSKIE
jgi:hypothetical protein